MPFLSRNQKASTSAYQLHLRRITKAINTLFMDFRLAISGGKRALTSVKAEIGILSESGLYNRNRRLLQYKVSAK